MLLPPHYLNTERETTYMRETTRKLCLRAARQQAGASPATAVAIGSGERSFRGPRARRLFELEPGNLNISAETTLAIFLEF